MFQTLQDLNSVSELLDSCTVMDLGSEVQTSRLLEHFSQARPHFTVSPGFETWWSKLRRLKLLLSEPVPLDHKESDRTTGGSKVPAGTGTVRKAAGITDSSDVCPGLRSWNVGSCKEPIDVHQTVVACLHPLIFFSNWTLRWRT